MTIIKTWLIVTQLEKQIQLSGILPANPTAKMPSKTYAPADSVETQ
jgi:hypothetical protein